MRTRVAVLAAVVAFAVAVSGVAVVAARKGDGSGLERLPFATTGAERDMAMSAPAGVVEYVLKGSLPDLPDEAPAFRLGDEGASTAIRRIADALGVEADKVGVERVPGLPWYLSSTKLDQAVSSCAAPAEPMAPDRPVVGCVLPSPRPAPVAVADLPSKDEAERLARAALERLGVADDGLELLGGTYAWDATVSPSVGGLPTRGLETGLSIGPKGEITAAHGFLGTPDRIGDYPLVGPAAGFERLQKGVGIGPQPLADRDLAYDRQRQVVTVTGARLALLHVGELLVPVYEFLTDGGGALTAPAVTDRWLAEQQPQAPQPVPEPDRGDVSSGSGSCSASAAPAPADGGNAPLTVQVCVEPAKARVGEEVVFTVTVADEDAEIYTDTCEGPEVDFGDELVVRTLCKAGCRAGPRDAARPGRYEHTYRHAYAKAGTFTATFAFRSGLCTSGSSSGKGSVEVVVYE